VVIVEIRWKSETLTTSVGWDFKCCWSYLAVARLVQY